MKLSLLSEGHHEDLGVKRGATKKELKRAWRVFAKQYHPDRHPEANEKEREELNRKFQKGNRAYDALMAKEPTCASHQKNENSSPLMPGDCVSCHMVQWSKNWRKNNPDTEIDSREFYAEAGRANQLINPPRSSKRSKKRSIFNRLFGRG